jgi:hypothetical protein
MQFLFSNDCCNQLVVASILAPIVVVPFMDMFVNHALQLSTVLHDPSLALIVGAKGIIVDT